MGTLNMKTHIIWKLSRSDPTPNQLQWCSAENFLSPAAPTSFDCKHDVFTTCHLPGVCVLLIFTVGLTIFGCQSEGEQ